MWIRRRIWSGRGTGRTAGASGVVPPLPPLKSYFGSKVLQAGGLVGEV